MVSYITVPAREEVKCLRERDDDSSPMGVRSRGGGGWGGVKTIAEENVCQ